MAAGAISGHGNARRDQQPQKERRGHDRADLGAVKPAAIKPDRRIGHVHAVDDKQCAVKQGHARPKRLAPAVPLPFAAPINCPACQSVAPSRPLRRMSGTAKTHPGHFHCSGMRKHPWRKAPRITYALKKSVEKLGRQCNGYHLRPATIAKPNTGPLNPRCWKSARGRWFLAEHGRRARRLDSALLEDAIGRLQTSLRQPPALLGQLRAEIETLKAISPRRAPRLLAKPANGQTGDGASTPPASDPESGRRHSRHRVVAAGQSVRSEGLRRNRPQRRPAVRAEPVAGR